MPQAAPLPARLLLPPPLRLRAVLTHPPARVPLPPPLLFVVPVRVLPVGDGRLVRGPARGAVAGVVAAVLLPFLLEPSLQLNAVGAMLLPRPPLLAVVAPGAVGLG